jgi:four helix bundle protein
MSIPLNIAEGSGRPGTADRARFYSIARGSTMECGAILDVCRVAGFGEDLVLQEGKRALARMAAMLTKMCR